MRVVRYYEHGGPEVLRVQQEPEPEPGPGQVRLRTEAIGASFVDTAMRANTLPFGPSPLPGSPHGEVVGVVDAVGSDVDEALLGTRMAALVEDAYADAVLAGADWATPVPDGMSAADGTVLAMAAPCAMIALALGGFRPGESVLVHAAAGSIGHLAVQLARAYGAGTVIGLVGSPAKKDFVRALGADLVVSLADDWAGQVRAALPDGVDVAVDVIGGAVSGTTLELLSGFGRQVVFGAAGGTLPELPSAPLLGMRSVTGFGMYQWRAARPAEARRHLAALSRHLADGTLRPATATTVPLDEPWRAHALLVDRTRTGRVLLTPG